MTKLLLPLLTLLLFTQCQSGKQRQMEEDLLLTVLKNQSLKQEDLNEMFYEWLQRRADSDGRNMALEMAAELQQLRAIAQTMGELVNSETEVADTAFKVFTDFDDSVLNWISRWQITSHDLATWQKLIKNTLQLETLQQLEDNEIKAALCYSNLLSVEYILIEHTLKSHALYYCGFIPIPVKARDTIVLGEYYSAVFPKSMYDQLFICLLYTSDAADE